MPKDLKRRRLTRLKFNRVDMVDHGANFDPATGDGAHILLVKRADDREKRRDEARGLCELLPAIEAVIATTLKSLKAETATLFEKADDALSFEDALFARKMGEVQQELAMRFGALMESVDSVMFSDESKKKAAVAERVGQFVASVKSAIPDLLKNLEKRGPADEILAALLTLEDVEEETVMKFDKSKLDAAALKAYEALETEVTTQKAAVETLTAEVAELKKTAKPAETSGGEETEEQQLAKVADVGVRALLKKSFAETRAAKEEARKATETADVEKKARLKRGEIEFLKSFKAVPVDAEKDADHVLALKAAAPKSWERVVELLKACEKIITSGRHLFKVVGKDGGGDQDDSAVEITKRKAADLIAKNDKLTIGQAYDQVFKEDPDLYTSYRGETEVQIGAARPQGGGE